jgi:hypothetical protein
MAAIDRGLIVGGGIGGLTQAVAVVRSGTEIAEVTATASALE